MALEQKAVARAAYTRLNSIKETDEESKVTQEAVLRTQERMFVDWNAVLEWSTYWRTM